MSRGATVRKALSLHIANTGLAYQPVRTMAPAMMATVIVLMITMERAVNLVRLSALISQEICNEDFNIIRQ